MKTYNELTQQYLDAWAGQQELTVQQLRDEVRPRIERTIFQGNTLSRPGFLQREELAEVAGDMETLYQLVTSLPNRLFGGDLAAFAASTGITPAQVQAVVRSGGEKPSRMARADLYRDETGLRVMELNMSSAIGGIDASTVNRALLELPFIKGFVEEHQLGYTDTMREIVETLRIEGNVPEGSRPAVALCDWPASYVTLEEQLRANVPVFEALGIDPLPCHIGQLRLEDDSIWLGDRQIDVLFRLFLMEDLLDPDGPALIEPVLRAAERGNVAVFSPMGSELYSSKGTLALLSDEANRHLFDERELATLDRCLPWTRMARPGPVTVVGGGQVQLEDYAMAEREELILKPTLLHGGSGVVPGWQTEPGEWKGLISDAMDSEYVLQRRIHPFTEPFPKVDGPGLEDWVLLWGVFLGARGYAGTFLRGTPVGETGVVNMATGATGAPCFHQLD